MLSSRDDKPVRVRGSASLDEDASCSSAITGQPLLVRGQNGALASQQASGCYMLPMEFSATTEQSVVRTHLALICQDERSATADVLLPTSLIP